MSSESRDPSMAVVGDAALDLYFVLPGGARRDEKATASVSHRDLGGTGANAAVAAARLGSRVRLFGALGRDPIGDWLLSMLIERRIDPSGVARVDGPSPVVAIVMSEGRREVFVDRGVADRLGHVDSGGLWSESGLAYLSAVPLEMAERVAGAKPPGGLFVIGIEERQLSTDAYRWRRVAQGADAVLVNEPTAEFLGFTFGSDRPCPVVVTRGAGGATVLEGGLATDLPGIPMDAVDSTGAGDCFAGALCHFLLNGLPLGASARLANVAAALSTTALGAQAGLPDEAGVLRATGPIDLSATIHQTREEV